MNTFKNSIIILLFLLLAMEVSVGYAGKGGGVPADLPKISDARSKRINSVIGLEPGQRVTLAEIEGAGVIRHMWFTTRNGSETGWADVVLRIYWDGEENPSVQAPFADFFGVGFGQERDVKAGPIEMLPAIAPNRAALNCYFPMPFSKGARITAEHTGEKAFDLFFWKINYEEVRRVPKDWGRFHAQWRREKKVKRGGPYTILEAEGRGHYVGTLMNYHILEPGSWVEGGEDFFIDGDKAPTLVGIGSEDYFGMSWGYRKEYHTLRHGTTLGPDGPFMTVFRFHLDDPIHFSKSFKMTMRCHGWDVQGRSDDYSSVAYWYQLEPHKPFPPLPTLRDRLPEEVLNGTAFGNGRE